MIELKRENTELKTRMTKLGRDNSDQQRARAANDDHDVLVGLTWRVDGKCRPIVAKLSRFKQREVVRLAGPKLAGKRFGISEQIPKEWQDKRKTSIHQNY